jgi:hypothetical protein
MTTIRLTGPWSLATDPDDDGRDGGWPAEVRAAAVDAPVPGVFQQVFPDYHGVAWYWTRFDGPELVDQERCFLDFGAVDYKATVWVDGHELGSHEGGDSPFSLDATGTIRTGASHLLAVRVVNPTDEPIDGLVLRETPHRNKTISRFHPGQGYNYGGIMLPVELRTAPAVRIDDVVVHGDPESGAVALMVTIHSDLPGPTTAVVRARVVSGPLDAVADEVELERSLPGPDTVVNLRLRVTDPRLWDVADPFLYRFLVDLEAGAPGASVRHARSVRFGFRDFRIVDGFFELNGRRTFIRSTHTGNHFPVGQLVPTDPDLYRRDLVYAKAAGFNMVRFIAGMAWPEQLDFCDEIGLLVYEETLAGWLLSESPRMAEHFDRSIRQMIERDRNHASVVAWGLLNETFDGPLFRHAVDALSLVRELDSTRLVLLSSGRWDGQPAIGSAANPGRRDWEHVWGVEGPEADPLVISPKWDLRRLGYLPTAGDVHLYPFAPFDAEVVSLVRSMGSDAAPVFLSEYGVGSLFDAVRESRGFDAQSAWGTVPDAVYIRSMANRFVADWHRFGLDGLFPFPEDFLRASHEHMARQRSADFDAIRSNPRIAGYNLTGMLDHALSGEGLWTFWRKWKPGIMDVVSDGWSRLRWCLFVDPHPVEAGGAVRIEAVLANDSALAPGVYPARFRIQGPAGPVWERTAEVRIEADSAGHTAFAVPVLALTVRLPATAGRYVLAASLERGGDADAGRRSFEVLLPASAPPVRERLTTWGLPGNVADFLTGHGLSIDPIEASADPGRVILIGDPALSTADLQTTWERVAAAVRAGSTAVIIGAAAFEGEPAPGADRALPIARDIRVRWFHDWLYHKDGVAKPHPLFDGLPAGFLDWDLYGQTIPDHLLESDRDGQVAAAAFAVGSPIPGGYASGILAGQYVEGNGRLLVSLFRILKNVGSDPAADRLLLNLVVVALRTDQIDLSPA